MIKFGGQFSGLPAEPSNLSGGAASRRAAERCLLLSVLVEQLLDGGLRLPNHFLYAQIADAHIIPIVCKARDDLAQVCHRGLGNIGRRQLLWKNPKGFLTISL